MRRKVLSLTLILILCMVFTACSGPSDRGKDQIAETEATEPKAVEKVFTSDDGQFCITADEDWEDAEDVLQIQDAVLAISKNAEGYITLISENKYNFSQELSGYNKLVVKHMEKNVDQETASEPEQVKLGEYDAYKTIMSGKVDDLEVVYVIYCAEVDDSYVQLICWSLKKAQDKFAAEFDSIAQSLSSAEELQE